MSLFSIIGCTNQVIIDNDENIDFYFGSDLIGSYSAHDLGDKLKVHEIEINDVEYHKTKQYKAFLFDEVVSHVFTNAKTSSEWNSVSFVALDGYNAVIDRAFFGDKDSYLVFSDQEYPSWEAIPNHGEETAAPYYLIWTKAQKIPQNGYSWPWGIAEIALVDMAEEYTHATPDSSNASVEVYTGYKLYMSRCNSCHSLGGQGGYIGPDLNEPMNILEYRSEDMVRAFIQESSKFRRGRMPDFKDLEEKEVDNLIAYLHYLKNEKNSSG